MFTVYVGEQLWPEREREALEVDFLLFLLSDRNSDRGRNGCVGSDRGGACRLLRAGLRPQTSSPGAHALRPGLLSHCDAAARAAPRRPSGAKNVPVH